MLSFLPGQMRGIFSIILYFINTVFWCIPLFLIAIIKLAVPIMGFRELCNKILIVISFSWIFCNNMNQKLFNKTDFRVQGLEGLKRDDWYLVISNHQSWVDILVLQRIFYKRIPFLKFFLKKELIWVPILGLAWWALDFPFMKRYSTEFLKKNPHLKGKDLEITKKACRKFSTTPVSVMNFLEGTRFSDEKHQRQKSSYKHLLKPKAGGAAFVLAAMGQHLNSIINITIVYPSGPESFWAYLCGKVPAVRVKIEIIPITKEIIGDYFEDEKFREKFQLWVNELWEEKDRTFESMS